MKKTATIACLIGLVFYSVNAMAFMYFDVKGVQDGVQYGDCSFNGRYLGTGSWQQCYNATQNIERQIREKNGGQTQEQPKSVVKPRFLTGDPLKESDDKSKK